MQFDVDGAERLRITSAGRVGIGTDDPEARLTVRSAGGTDGGFRLNGATGALARIYESGSDGFVELATGENPPITRIKISAYGDSYINPANNGAVNIGSTINYGGLLSVNRPQVSGVANLLTLRDASAGTTFDLQTFGDPTFGTANRFNYTGPYLSFRQSDTEILRLSTTSNGGSSFSSQLNVDNNIVLTQASSGNSAIDIPFTYNDTTDQRARFTGTNMKHLGFFQHRAGSQYLHIKTNINSNSCMFMFHAFGYLYNSGNLVSWAGGYTYTPPSSILNQFNINSGNCSVATYRTSSPAGGGFLCLRINRNNSGYSEGQLSVFFHSHSTGIQNSTVVTAWAQNNNGGNFFTS